MAPANPTNDLRDRLGNQGVLRALRGAQAGQRVPLPHREDVERRLGRDLSMIDARTGSTASEACNRVGAQAFAFGHLTVFARPDPPVSTVLHEVTHALQQGPAQPGSPSLVPEQSEDEREAARVASGAGGTIGVSRSAPAVALKPAYIRLRRQARLREYKGARVVDAPAGTVLRVWEAAPPTGTPSLYRVDGTPVGLPQAIVDANAAETLDQPPAAEPAPPPPAPTPEEPQFEAKVSPEVAAPPAPPPVRIPDTPSPLFLPPREYPELPSWPEKRNPILERERQEKERRIAEYIAEHNAWGKAYREQHFPSRAARRKFLAEWIEAADERGLFEEGAQARQLLAKEEAEEANIELEWAFKEIEDEVAALDRYMGERMHAQHRRGADVMAGAPSYSFPRSLQVLNLPGTIGKDIAEWTIEAIETFVTTAAKIFLEVVKMATRVFSGGIIPLYELIAGKDFFTREEIDRWQIVIEYAIMAVPFIGEIAAMGARAASVVISIAERMGIAAQRLIVTMRTCMLLANRGAVAGFQGALGAVRGSARFAESALVAGSRPVAAAVGAEAVAEGASARAGRAVAGPALGSPQVNPVVASRAATAAEAAEILAAEQERLTARGLTFQGTLPHLAAAHGTTAVAPAVGPDGRVVDLVASTASRGPLREALAAEAGDREILVPHSGGHAELQIAEWAANNGYTLLNMGPSRPFCPICAMYARANSLGLPGARVQGRPPVLLESLSDEELFDRFLERVRKRDFRNPFPPSK